MLRCKNIRKIVRPHIFSNYSKLYFYYFAKNCGAKTRMLLIKIKILRSQSEVALTTLAGRYFISICMYCVCSLWPLLVFVIVFRVIFVLYCSLVVILIFVLLYLDLGLLFVLRLIAFFCYFLIVLFSFVICVIYSAKATDCLLFKRTVSVGFSHLKFTDYLVGHGAPKHKL